MRRLLIIFTVLSFLFSSVLIGFAQEPVAEVQVASETEGQILKDKAITQDVVTEEVLTEQEQLLNERPALPPILPPSNMTPDQVRSFFTKPGEKAEEEEFMILNFDDADIKDILATVSAITKVNFILGTNVSGKITIHSAEKIPVSEVFSVFETILQVNNLSLVKSGSFFKVLPSSEARQNPLEIFQYKDAKTVPYGDRLITQLIYLEHIPIKDMSGLLKDMISKVGSITPHPRLNMLIINDLASNLKNVLRIIDEVDVDAFKDTRMSFYRLKNSDVATLSKELLDIINALNIGREGLSIIPIERLNSLVVFSSGPGLLKTIEAWIHKLDDEVTTGQNIFVYNVQNVDAKKIAAVLKTIYEKSASIPTVGESAPPKEIKKDATPTTKSGTAQSLSQSTVESSGRVEIDTFESTNSLVILASPGVYKEISDTIKKLDMYPKQVLIEVVIAEVNLDDDNQFGIQWSLLRNINIEGITSPDAQGLVQNSAKIPPLGTALPTLGAAGNSGLSLILFDPGRITAMIHALASTTKLNILSSPRLLVRDKEEASIEVGSDIPIATSTTSISGTTTATQNIEYKTVGIKLKIKPSINDEKTVVLNVEQEVSDTGADQSIGPEGYTYPSFSTRLTKTSVVVPDNKGILIGGIIKERNEKGYQGIPLLSAIPYLGSLFRYTTMTKSKTELVIFLTPHVVTNSTEADMVTSDFVSQLKNLKKSVKKEDISSDIFKPYTRE
ncbi:MAG: type II secretion system secretin GspD [Thermodesulfovibrionia bacterium]|nr:type II secretion system secretin GspD [Thermodesulfovibrionia bacterium]